jgi:DnaK suppressor protein
MTTMQNALTPEQLGQIRCELQRTLSRLERNMKLNGNGRPPEIDQSAVGRLSRIEALQNQGFTQNLQERERVQLAQVMDALKRLEDGCYGVCTACRGPVGFERLMVFPEARHCTRCSNSN